MAKTKMSKRSSKQYKQDILYFRMSCLFLLVCAAVLGIFKLSGRAGLQFFRLARNPVYLVVLGALCALFFVIAYINKKNKKDESENSFAAINIASVLAYLFGISLYWGFAPVQNPWILLVATVASALLYFIYYIYKKDFFVFSLCNVIFALTVFFFSFGTLFGTILAALFLVLSVLACLYCSKQANASKGGKGYAFRFEPTYVSFLIAVAVIVFGFFINLPVVNGSMISAILFFQYLAFGIYYTIKLIREA